MTHRASSTRRSPTTPEGRRPPSPNRQWTRFSPLSERQTWSASPAPTSCPGSKPATSPCTGRCATGDGFSNAPSWHGITKSRPGAARPGPNGRRPRHRDLRELTTAIPVVADADTCSAPPPATDAAAFAALRGTLQSAAAPDRLLERLAADGQTLTAAALGEAWREGAVHLWRRAAADAHRAFRTRLRRAAFGWEGTRRAVATPRRGPSINGLAGVTASAGGTNASPGPGDAHDDDGRHKRPACN